MMTSKRLLVANRGEIATRILSTARELGLRTIAVYTEGDNSHTKYAHEAIRLSNAASYLDVGNLVKLCQQHKIDLVHPGYGFLSESDKLCEQLFEAGIIFVGPDADILRSTGDKLRARKLAETCNVPVLPALSNPTDSLDKISEFAKTAGWPIMIKAADGGGGRGIRLVHREKDLEPSFRRALNESPSRKVFAEKAAIGDYRHVEVQILGDGREVRHFWERECSIQRKFQKIIEIAPSVIEDRELISSVIESAVRIAEKIKYKYLGTWEFLLSPSNSSFYFMEINPRLQVEHTITETICGVDLVRYQLLIALDQKFKDIGLHIPSPSELPPPSKAIQLRLTAEDPRHDFSLSVGKLTAVNFPGGNGTRIDTHVRQGSIVSADFDSLLAKLIVSSSDWRAVVDKASRVLQDVSIDGVTTNAELLRGIVLSEDFYEGRCDTQWLERNLEIVLKVGTRAKPSLIDSQSASSTQPTKPQSSSSALIKKGDTFTLRLRAPGLGDAIEEALTVTKLKRNDFPTNLAIELSKTGRSPNDQKAEETYSLELSQSTGAQAQTTGRKGNSKNPSHLICPLAGQLVEMLVDEGDTVDEWEPVAIVRQMKMELEVRAQRRGIIKSLWEVQEGDDVSSGMLVCEIVDERVKEKL